MGRAEAVFKAPILYKTANDIYPNSRSHFTEYGKLLAGVCIFNKNVCVLIFVVLLRYRMPSLDLTS